MHTYFNLIAHNIKDERQFDELVKTMDEYQLIGYAFLNNDYYNHQGFFEYYDSVQWTNHAEEMVAIAEKFPNVYFELRCHGEENDVHWKEYYHDMDIEVCQGEVVYEQPKKVQWTELVPF